MKTSQSISKIAGALVKFQSEVSNPKNTASNPMYKSRYAPLDVVIETVKPILAKHELMFMQDVQTDESREYVTIITTLIHSSGEYIKSSALDVPAFKLLKGGAKSYDAQAQGIAITYGRRYQLTSMLGIAGQDDDDGNGLIHETGSKPIQKLASSKQIGLIKVKAMELAKTRGVAPMEVFKTIGMETFDGVTSQQASVTIKKLEKWLEQAKELGGVANA
ncbi:MAG TPA: ERF family protein [Massilibacterium sp.]|nr:ERF family protein [Massilibacterium sp.]